MSSDAELDTKLTELLRVMVSRLPANKKLPTSVVQQLLRGKYAETYSEAYVTSHEAFITDTVLKLLIEKEKAAVAATAAAQPAVSSESGEDDDDDDSSSDDDGDGDESEEEEDEEESDDNSDSGSEGDDDDEPSRKKARQEELDAIAQKEQQPGSTANVADRCKAMASCLRKLNHRVRAPTAEESLEDYLKDFLIAEFEKHGMDPERYDPADLKRYKAKREVELLEKDGASMNLDRRSRVGRGFSDVPSSKASGGNNAFGSASSPARPKQSSMVLDDEE